MKILFLQKRPLFPTNDGGKVRTLTILRQLARRHDVTYLCNEQPHEAPHIRKMQELGLRMVTVPWVEMPRGTFGFYRHLAWNLRSPNPFNVDKDFDSKLRQLAAELLRDEEFDILICDFVQMARNAIGLDSPSSVLFTHNVEAEIFRRHAATDEGWLRRRYMNLQYRKMQRFEATAGHEFDTVIAVSERDRDTFEREYGWNHVHAIDTAVDTHFYQPDTQAEVPDRIVFVGSLDWLPNVDGLRYFVRECWPRIRSSQPTATFHIVGRNPGPAIQRLTEEAGIEVFADVPDVRPHLAQAAVVVVPLLVGGGTRLKIFEAMAMEKAVVSTSLGAEGLKVDAGKHLELADDAEMFATCVLRLLEEDDRRRGMARTASEYVVANFSAEIVARQFEDICIAAAEKNGHFTVDHSRRRS